MGCRSRVQTQSQRRALSSLILVTVLATSLLLTGGAFYYKEYMVHYKGLFTPSPLAICYLL